MLTYSPLGKATDEELRHLARLIDEIEQSRLKEKYRSRPIADDACFLAPENVPQEILSRCRLGKGGYCLIQRTKIGWINYLGESGDWVEVSAMSVTKPRTYSSRNSAEGGRKWQANKNKECEVAVWLHPESEWPERDKYLLMTGQQYTGSPSQ